MNQLEKKWSRSCDKHSFSNEETRTNLRLVAKETKRAVILSSLCLVKERHSSVCLRCIKQEQDRDVRE